MLRRHGGSATEVDGLRDAGFPILSVNGLGSGDEAVASLTGLAKAALSRL